MTDYERDSNGDRGHPPAANRTGGASRRAMLSGAATVAAAGVAGCVGILSGGSDDGNSALGTARLSTGSTSMVAPIIEAKGWDEDNGFALETSVRNSISAYYGDFVSGTYATLPFGVSSAANRYNKGVGMKLFAGFDYSSMFWLSDKDDISSAADFEGKTVAAPLSAGSYQVANAVVKRETGKTVESLASQVVNAPGPANPLQEVVTGNADVALSWEPALSTFLTKNPDSNVETVVDVREKYRDHFGADSFHLVWAVKESALEANRDAVEGLAEANRRVGELYANKTDEALDIVVENTENERAPLAEALKSGRQEFALTPLSEVKADVKTQFEVFADLGVIDEVPDDGIYADI